MNTNQTQQIAQHVVRIAELAATFQAAYGPDYRITERSPQRARELYDAIMAEQAAVARLLHPDAVEQRYSRYGRWWERGDVMSTAIVNELASEVFALISRSAYAQASKDGLEWSPSVETVQRSIAGMLHPDALPRTAQVSEAM